MRSSLLSKGILFGVAALLLLTSCEKEAGEGGNSSIKGYVHVTDYDAFLINVQGEYPGADEDVYIIYGNDISYGDRIRTGPDGVFEFKYLREGDYKVYVYSADTSLAGKVAVMKNVSITGKKQTVDAGTFNIKKK
jgi:hypothetical protein